MKRTEVRGRRRLLDDFFKVDEAEVSFERADGSMTPPARRLVFERGDSVAAGSATDGTSSTGARGLGKLARKLPSTTSPERPSAR